ncbi:hypothetical protein A3844_20700 [Paenibacillus helianthi]|uniref:Uncharacterized protein n=1 Tax=Paenibacillus helianthi TaxID=1349432 RepID=A0ABX3EJ40_9BACL|nr:hypothetical protein [Paenibacillus helianthi]OKP83996.1 hypothetical protein A3844_20700 [Paenibacillus helianthi]
MNTMKIVGRSALAAVLLVLAGCNAAPEAEPKATLAPEQTQVSPSPTASPTASPTVSPTASPLPSEPAESQQPQASAAPEEGMPPTAEEAATTVLRALKAGDMETLASWAHPDKGVRFSPYAYVDTATDLVFTRDKLKGLMKDPKPYVWREFAGSGEIMKLTFAEYFKRFVYDADFLNDAKTALNKGLGQGTTLNNINEVYPKDKYDFVEYYIAGVDPANEGMDWRSLRLVFEKIGEDHALVGIVHDQWTP